MTSTVLAADGWDPAFTRRRDSQAFPGLVAALPATSASVRTVKADLADQAAEPVGPLVPEAGWIHGGCAR